MAVASEQAIKPEKRSIRFFVKSLGLWFLTVAGVGCIEGFATGHLAFGRNELYSWKLWAPGLILSLETGAAVTSLLIPFRKLARMPLRILCAAIVGLVIPAVIGFLSGLVEEKMGDSLLWQWNAMDGYTLGLESALPSALASVIAILWFGRITAKHNSRLPTN